MNAQVDTLQSVMDRFWDTIPPIWNQFHANIRAVGCEQYGITVEQFHLLRHIRRGVSTVSDLAEARMTSRPAVSQGVEVLVGKGLVSRHTDPGDRRFIKLSLTEAGADLINTIYKRNRAWMREKLETRSPEELATIYAALDLLHETFLSE